ncbi:MAG: lipase family protein [Aeromicrobium sp.]
MTSKFALRRGHIAAVCATSALALVVTAAPAVTASATASSTPKPAGTVLKVSALPASLWLPSAAKAVTLTYVTQDTFGKPGTSTGTVMIPKGKAPAGGWPVISWAHGTIGLGDACAPSRIGPALGSRDNPHLDKFLSAGYAVVASDYAGLGTPGLHAYLDGRTAAHNIVDMVNAGRTWAASLPASQRLARKYVIAGQSQGGGAAIYAARYATEFGGSNLDYRGAVGTGTPAYIETLLTLGGPKVPPVPLTPGMTAYVTYLIASINYSHPELGIGAILTDTGRKYLKLAETECIFQFEESVAKVSLGDYFTKPLASLPGFTNTVNGYMKMPESGFDKPFFMGHGALDTDVPYAITLPYVAALILKGQPVTFKTYPTDHSGALIASEKDTAPYIADLFQ